MKCEAGNAALYSRDRFLARASHCDLNMNGAQCNWSILRVLAVLWIGTASLLIATSATPHEREGPPRARIPPPGGQRGGEAASVGGSHEPDAEEIALGSLVDAELAFARMASQQGVRAAFLANFAPEGIALEPEPVRVQQAWRSRPAQVDPLAIQLDWKPAQAGVARSHDFGYTTGPFTVRTKAQPQTARHGTFFSVWQRDANGRWQVILDAGTSSPGAVDFAALGASPRPAFGGHARPDTARRELLALESRNGASSLAPNDYAKLLADDARLHVNEEPPLASRAAIARAVALRTRRIAWTPIGARVARSADMAVTWGTYEATGRDAQVRRGNYAHLWLRDRGGDWRLAYDVALP
jgi:ketosteroid isomerase-like protein